ncbi:feruloyl-CoA synthase [Nitrospirillum pindoramense]|uniref:Trans-feruloyl-CoA synthase n=1 Tax=Nitrospirillum amazonense TaxID=28077 RepID=A0A560HDM2_9PROT|nr:feruloyl-CoA synthase [Nitrospirillum amazonense]TWB43510.1 trans-feruloyl-CoA synthase [Nitrospirillum amazonense]
MTRAASPSSADARYRAVSVNPLPVRLRQEPGGVWHLHCADDLAPYPRHLLERLEAVAATDPGRTLVAQRGPDGEWRRISYGGMLADARAIGQALLDRGLSADRPVAILSGNSVDHLRVAAGALYAGVPHCPVSTGYSLLSRDFQKLRLVMETVTPGLVFVDKAPAYAAAIAAVVPADVETVASSGSLPHRAVTPLADLLATVPTTVDAVYQALTPDTVAKFLFTSGSASTPKAVTTTQRMLCANQQMLLQSFPVFGEEPPVIVDWLPWNHTYGGSHNVGIALYNGGSYYIDDGKPTQQHFAETLRNLRDISPTVHFNVPKGWEDLTAALEEDAELRHSFYARMRMFFFGGAGLSQAAWDRLDRVTEAHCGARIPVFAGLGMTETSPSCLFTTGGFSLGGSAGALLQAGYVGLPAPGCAVKLVPVGDKLEARFAGPHVMPGYWRAPDRTAAAFDEDGYYRTGDGVRWLDPMRPELGLVFDGRLTEDFKLSSGTFVNVGPLRARVITEGAPYVQDVVIAAPERDDLGLLIFPNVEACADLAALPAGTPIGDILAALPVRRQFQALVDRLAATATGSANRVARALVLADAPSLDKGEVTDKRSINQRMVLTQRAALVDALYQGTAPGIYRPAPSS